jgi:hypothetical protein
MGMVDHAKEELKYLRGSDEPDETQDWVEKNIIEIIETFAAQGHSGGSAGYCIPIIHSLLKQENITPLTGEDSEWMEVSPGVFQNKRMGTIFKDKSRFGGRAYWLDGKIFSDDGGKTWVTNSDSFVPITFPFTAPKPEKIIRKQEED